MTMTTNDRRARFATLSLPLALAALTGCKQAPAESHASAPAPVVTPAAVDPVKALALQKVTGTTHLDEEIAAAQRVVQDLPKKLDAWIVLGRTWVRKARESGDPGYYVNADACAKVALDLAPDNKLALDLRGLVLLNDHKFDEARALAAHVVTKYPDGPMGYGNLSDASLELGRYDEAAEAAQAMVDLKPNLPSYSRASYLRWLHGDVEEATSIVRKAIDAGDARDPEPLCWVTVQAAMIFWHQGDDEGADAGFDLALKRIASYPPALVGKGRVAMARRDYARAAELFARAYEGSALVETAWLLGDARAAAGDADGAAKAYALVEKDGRKNDPRTYSLYLSTKGKDAALALALANEEKKVRGDVYTDDVLAWALYRSGRFADAVEASGRAIALGTKDARLLYHAGRIRIAAGDAKKGKELVARALALNPRFDATEVGDVVAAR
jgi:tetratricopeptide (TPR) repeat protein